MTVMTLDKKITLQKRRDSSGYGSGDVVVSTKNVYAKVTLPSLSFQAKAEAAGRRADMTAHLWRKDFDTDNYTHAVIGGTVYRIDSVGSSVNDLYVKIALERD